MAMAEVPDRGNPNFFTLFNGSHVAQLAGSSSTSNVFMLTSMNTVQFLGDCTAGADGRMWVLPEECRPKNPVRFMCPIEPTGDVPGASYEVVVDVTAESKAVEVVTGISTGASKALTQATLSTETSKALTQATLSTETSKALTQATLSTETATAVDGVEMSTSQVGNLVSSPSPMNGAGLTAGQYDDLVGASALSSATMTQTEVEVLSGVALQTAEVEVLSGAGLQTAEGEVLSGVALQTAEGEVLSGAGLQTAEGEVLSGAGLQTEEGDFLVSATAVSGSMEVAGMPNVKKSVIKVPDTPGSTFAVVTVMPDGTISGEPGVLHYTNGHMFSISDNWYLEG